MDLKRIFRGWMLAILLVFVLLIVVLKFTGSSQYQKVATSQVVHLVESGQVKTATLTVPTQEIQVTTFKGGQFEAAVFAPVDAPGRIEVAKGMKARVFGLIAVRHAGRDHRGDQSALNNILVVLDQAAA